MHMNIDHNNALHIHVKHPYLMIKEKNHTKYSTLTQFYISIHTTESQDILTWKGPRRLTKIYT